MSSLFRRFARCCFKLSKNFYIGFLLLYTLFGSAKVDTFYLFAKFIIHLLFSPLPIPSHSPSSFPPLPLIAPSLPSILFKNFHAFFTCGAQRYTSSLYHPKLIIPFYNSIFYLFNIHLNFNTRIVLYKAEKPIQSQLSACHIRLIMIFQKQTIF